jgi:hypothetical protein
MKYNKEAGTVVCVALTAFNKSRVNDLMIQKAVADRIHTLVGDVIPSNAIVSQVSALLADHSQCYDKPRSDLFVVDANPNILVFDSLMSVNSSCQATCRDGKSICFSQRILSREAKRPRTEAHNG